MKAGTFTIQDNVDILLIDRKTRKVKSRRTLKNLIVNSGLEVLAKLLNGVTTASFSAIAIGTDNTTVNASDTTLGSETQRAEATLAYEASYKATFSHEFSFPSSMTIYELGIFNNNVSGGDMLNHAVEDAGIGVDEDTNLLVEVDITVSTT